MQCVGAWNAGRGCTPEAHRRAAEHRHVPGHGCAHSSPQADARPDEHPQPALHEAGAHADLVHRDGRSGQQGVHLAADLTSEQSHRGMRTTQSSSTMAPHMPMAVKVHHPCLPVCMLEAIVLEAAHEGEWRPLQESKPGSPRDQQGAEAGQAGSKSPNLMRRSLAIIKKVSFFQLPLLSILLCNLIPGGYICRVLNWLQSVWHTTSNTPYSQVWPLSQVGTSLGDNSQPSAQGKETLSKIDEGSGTDSPAQSPVSTQHRPPPSVFATQASDASETAHPGSVTGKSQTPPTSPPVAAKDVGGSPSEQGLTSLAFSQKSITAQRALRSVLRLYLYCAVPPCSFLLRQAGLLPGTGWELWRRSPWEAFHPRSLQFEIDYHDTCSRFGLENGPGKTQSLPTSLRDTGLQVDVPQLTRASKEIQEQTFSPGSSLPSDEEAQRVDILTDDLSPSFTTPQARLHSSKGTHVVCSEVFNMGVLCPVGTRDPPKRVSPQGSILVASKLKQSRTLSLNIPDSESSHPSGPLPASPYDLAQVRLFVLFWCTTPKIVW